MPDSSAIDASRPAASAAVGRVRARAELRLRGPTPVAVRSLEDRDPQARVATRDREPEEGPRMLGEGRTEWFSVRLVETKPPGPNAPLLARIVRHPFALATGRFDRSRVFEKFQREPLEKLGRPGAAWREAYAPGEPRNPIRAIPHGPEPRPWAPWKKKGGAA